MRRGRFSCPICPWVREKGTYLRRKPGMESAGPQQAAQDFIDGLTEGKLDDLA